MWVETVAFIKRATNLGTKAEPQQIVTQRLLSCLQYLVLIGTYTEDLVPPLFYILLCICVYPRAIMTQTVVGQGILVSSMDSGLEAFSHNPTDGSVVALAAQPTT